MMISSLKESNILQQYSLIVDNYIIQKSKKTQQSEVYSVLSVKYFRIEMLWQAWLETIPCNHQCKTVWKLLEQVRHCMDKRFTFSLMGYSLLKVELNWDQLVRE
ncbi:hypothetical protein DM586_18840 [Vibrio fluvialis]|nr:hypothetical protein DM586_18840 [Vibrio fluvialis]